MTGYRSLARNHDFTVLWVGQTISELGTRVSLFVFPLVGYALTGSTLVAALAEAVHLLGLVLTLLPAGVLADRVHRRRLLRLASGSGALLYGSLAAAALLGALTLPHLLVVALLTGAGVGLFSPTEVAALRAVVSTEELPTALSQNQARQHAASLVGGPLGGALYGVARWLPFTFDAVSQALAWLLLGRIRTDLAAPPRGDARPRPLHDVAEGMRFIWRSPFFRTLTAWAALTNLTVNALLFAAVLHLVEQGYAAWQIGLVETVSGVCGLVGAALAPWVVERVATGWLAVAVAWSFVPLVVPMALWTSPAVVAAAFGIGVLLNPVGNTGIASYRLAVTPPDLVARVQATSQFVSMSAMPLAPVLAGGLLALAGGPLTLGLIGAVIALGALVPTLSPSIRAVPRPDQWQAQWESSQGQAEGQPEESAAEPVSPSDSVVRA